MTSTLQLGVIPTGSGLAVRTGINQVDAATASDFSGAVAPAPTYAFISWRDTLTGLVKRRSSANDSWQIVENYGAIVAPTANDDLSVGYVQGARWFDTAAKKVYFCTNSATGAAVWKEVGAGGTGGAVADVFGRTGSVVAQTGDYSADQVSDTGTRVLMTSTERTKLAGIATGAQINPPAVSDSVITAGTSTSIASITPAQMKLSATTFGGGGGGGGSSGVIGSSPLGDAATGEWIGNFQQAAAANLSNIIALLHDQYFRTYHISADVIAISTDVTLPSAVASSVPGSAVLITGATRPGLASPSVGNPWTSDTHRSLALSLPSSRILRLDPSYGRSALTTTSKALVTVVDNFTQSVDPYYCWSLGHFEVSFTGTRKTLITMSLVAASVEGWGGTLTTAQWKKCVVIPGWNTGISSTRLRGFVAFLPDATNVAVASATNPGAQDCVCRFQIVCFEGSAWKVHHAYANTGSSTAQAADVSLRDTPPLASPFMVPDVSSVFIDTAGTGYAAGNVLSPPTSTGTAFTVTVATVTTGGVTTVTLSNAGSMSAVADSSMTMTGGGGTGCKISAGYTPVLAAQGSASSVTAWNRSLILSGMARAKHMTSGVVSALTDSFPIWKPGFGGGAEGSVLNAVRYNFGATADSHHLVYSYVLEDVGTSHPPDRRMLVTRFDSTDVSADPVDIDITAAGLTSIYGAMVIPRAITSYTLPGTGGYQNGTIGCFLVSPTALRLVRKIAELGTFAARFEIASLPRRPLV